MSNLKNVPTFQKVFRTQNNSMRARNQQSLIDRMDNFRKSINQNNVSILKNNKTRPSTISTRPYSKKSRTLISAIKNPKKIKRVQSTCKFSKNLN